MRSEPISIPTGRAALESDLTVPATPRGVVLFAHGSGSSRHSPRNRRVAEVLNDAGLATVLSDLLTVDEEREDAVTGALRFDIGLLAERLVGAVDWMATDYRVADLRLGLFGASTGAAAALVTAALRPEAVGAVVSRGGRPELAGAALSRVTAPTLLIVGGHDVPVIALNQRALEQLRGEKRLEIIPGATHLFPEPGALEKVAALARDSFLHHLAGRDLRLPRGEPMRP